MKTVRKNDPLVSCIIPAYNEEANIITLLDTLHTLFNSLNYRHEFVVVDDGSRDATAEKVINEAHRFPVTLIQLSRNFGKENALTAGIDHVKGDVTILLDGDFQHPPSYIPQFLDEWKSGVDMVFGIRSDRHTESLVKRAGAALFYGVMNFSRPNKIPENTQDFRALDRAVIDALKQLPERNRFMKGLYNWVGFTQKSVVIQVAPRHAGTSSFNFRKLFGLGLTGITAFSNTPLRIWGIIGAVISLCSIFYALWEVARALLIADAPPGWPTLTVAITFLGGIQLFSIGVLGEYIGRIFDEVKHRPIYIVKKIVRTQEEA